MLMAYVIWRCFVETAKIFMNGRSQAVRLPKEYRFEGSEVYIKKVGEVVMLIPRHASWGMMFKSLEMFTEDFMETRDQPEWQEREGMIE
jgi:antitoxin VapB